MNWQRKLLKDVVVDWIKGATPNRTRKEYYAEKAGVPWVKVSDLNDRDLRETENCLTEEGADRIGREVPKGAVLLSVSGTIGKVSIARVPLMVNQAVQAMVFREDMVLAEYAYYYFQFYRPWLERMANTVTIPNLTKTRLENTYILFPRMEEQRYIVHIMKRAEDMVKKQCHAYQGTERILDSIMERKREAFHGGNRSYTLRECLAESITFIPAAHRRKDAFTERMLLQPGDIVIRQHPSKKDENYLLITKKTDIEAAAAFTGSLLRVRVNPARLQPEVLLGWLRFASKYLGFHSEPLKAYRAADMEIPAAFWGIQDELTGILHKLFTIQDEVKRIEKKEQKFYQALLTAALTARLSKKYRTDRGFEEPDEDFILWHYGAKTVEIESDAAAKKVINPDAVFQGGQREIIKLLSDFQKEMLCKYLEEEKISMPIHEVLKNLKTENKAVCAGYSIQDAIAAVKILEGLGFLEKTIPEKLFLGENEITDLRGNAVTIQKYKAVAAKMKE
ncbi:MAG: restriction endonuclease subunit S [Bacillus sp. (in: Bacteria)]|nr:restriction endonuclease subunit S [Bacillus sp. (in: firmicutes)]MCM1427765.1 restriction endonuclease subunit S [Eubacterium sp.]